MTDVIVADLAVTSREAGQAAADPRPCRSPGADPEWWFAEAADVLATRRAKQLCDTCPLRLACLAIALARNERFGIWGGLSTRERRQLPRQHECCGCGGPAELRNVYCGDECRQAARVAGRQRSDRARRLRLPLAGGAA